MTREPTNAAVFVAALPHLQKHFERAAGQCPDREAARIFGSVAASMGTLSMLHKKSGGKSIYQMAIPDQNAAAQAINIIRALPAQAQRNMAVAAQYSSACDVYKGARMLLRQQF